MDILRVFQIGAVALLFLASGFYAYIMLGTASLTSEVMSSIRGPADPLQGRLDVQNTRMEHGDRGPLKDGYVALADYGNIDAGRRLILSLPVVKKDLFGDAEPMLEPDLEEVFLAGRAPAVAQAECELLLSSIATACRVEQASARPITGAPELVEITMRLAFTEKEQRGAFASAGPLYYDEVGADPAAVAGIGKTAGLAELRQMRIRLYEGAEKACAQLRRQEGNCSVTRLRIGARWNARQSLVSLHSEATLSYLSNRTISPGA